MGIGRREGRGSGMGLCQFLVDLPCTTGIWFVYFAGMRHIFFFHWWTYDVDKIR